MVYLYVVHGPVLRQPYTITHHTALRNTTTPLNTPSPHHIISFRHTPTPQNIRSPDISDIANTKCANISLNPQQDWSQLLAEIMAVGAIII